MVTMLCVLILVSYFRFSFLVFVWFMMIIVVVLFEIWLVDLVVMVLFLLNVGCRWFSDLMVVLARMFLLFLKMMGLFLCYGCCLCL